MPAPVLAKTWQYDVNQRFGPGTNTVTAAQVLLGIKNSLIGFASSPWEVWGSCDGVGGFGNGDAVDRWANIGDLVWAASGSNHSWIVLSQPGLGNNASICIDYIGAYEFTLFLSVSAGFGLANGGTNGTAVTRPTASDEVSIYHPSYYSFITSVSDYGFMLHTMQSTDGECTRLFLTYCSSSGRANYFMLLIDKAKNAVSWWLNPIFGFIISNAGTTVPTVDKLCGGSYYSLPASTPKIATLINGNEAILRFTCEGVYLGPLTAGQVGIIDGTDKYPLYGIGIISSWNERGRIGEVYDMWFPMTHMMITGDQFEDFEFSQFGQVVVPWNGINIKY